MMAEMDAEEITKRFGKKIKKQQQTLLDELAKKRLAEDKMLALRLADPVTRAMLEKEKVEANQSFEISDEEEKHKNEKEMAEQTNSFLEFKIAKQFMK